MINKEIDKVVRTISDFPKEGINFKDITPLLLDFNLTDRIIDEFIDSLQGTLVDFCQS